MELLFRTSFVIAAGLARADAPHSTVAFASQTPREFEVFATDVATGDGSSEGTPEWAPIFTEPK